MEASVRDPELDTFLKWKSLFSDPTRLYTFGALTRLLPHAAGKRYTPPIRFGDSSGYGQRDRSIIFRWVWRAAS